jgi:hypothetical protein
MYGPYNSLFAFRAAIRKRKFHDAALNRFSALFSKRNAARYELKHRTQYIPLIGTSSSPQFTQHLNVAIPIGEATLRIIF